MTTPLQGRAKLLRLAGIAATVLAVGAGFLYAAGDFGQRSLSPQRIIDTFEAQAGHHPGYRKNHAKGLCVSGYFDGNGQAAALSTARAFSQQRVPVIGRFAIGGANPHAPDTAVPVRSLALQLSTDDGQVWRTGMNNPPVLPVSTPEAFYEQVLAATPDPATGKPDPKRLQAFFAAHPESAAFREWSAHYQASDSFANTAYNSINAFRLIDGQGHAQPVRWRLEPATPFAALAKDASDPRVLQHDLQRRLSEAPLRWNLRLVLAQPGDPVDDPARPWPTDRPSVIAGTLVLDHVDPPEQGACRDLNFDPLILPRGIEASNDPILAARSAAYAESFNRRSREGQPTGEQP